MLHSTLLFIKSKLNQPRKSKCKLSHKISLWKKNTLNLCQICLTGQSEFKRCQPKPLGMFVAHFSEPSSFHCLNLNLPVKAYCGLVGDATRSVSKTAVENYMVHHPHFMWILFFIRFTPCRKYVEVLFKCKPASFRSRVVCGGETVALACPPNQPEFRWFFAPKGPKSLFLLVWTVPDTVRCH